ncbi:hypothetical protein GCM10027289_27730 [Tsukamurella serpentis]
MANPAELLHAQLTAWNAPSQPANDARQMGTESVTWSAHRQAVRHLEAIDELLNLMSSKGRNVTVYRDEFSNWCAHVFAFGSGWVAAGSGGIDVQSLRFLHALSGLLDYEVPEATPEARQSVQDFLSAATQVLNNSGAPAHLRMHLVNVINHAQWCLDHFDAAGDFELATALERLLGAIGVTAESDTDPESVGRWKTLLHTFVYPYATSTLAGLSSGTALLALKGLS